MSRSPHNGQLRAFARSLVLRSVLGAVAGLLIGVGAVALDRALGTRLPVDPQATQALLAAFIGGVLTIAVFAIWMRTVVVGLMSSQVSSRVLAAYLDDEFQQQLLGVMVGMLGYLVTVTALLNTDTQRTPLVSGVLSLGVVVAAMIGVLLAMRQAVSAMSLPSIVRTLADHVLELLEQQPAANEAPTAPPPEAFTITILSRDVGWVQKVDYDRLLAALDDRAAVDLKVDVGDFVAHGEPLCRLDRDVDEDTETVLRSAFSLARVRSTRRDLAYAIQQLVDVAESAMAPHSSDTSTAYEALNHLRAVLHELIRRGTASGARSGERGQIVVSSVAWSTAEHLEQVFTRLRAAATDHSFQRRIDGTIEGLLATAEEAGDGAVADALRRLHGQSPTAGGSTDPQERTDAAATS